MIYRLDQLKLLTDTYIEATKVSDTALSRRIFKSNNRVIDRFRKGKGMWAETAETMSDWYNANWPPGVPWPLAPTSDDLILRAASAHARSENANSNLTRVKAQLETIARSIDAVGEKIQN